MSKINSFLLGLTILFAGCKTTQQVSTEKDTVKKNYLTFAELEKLKFEVQKDIGFLPSGIKNSVADSAWFSFGSDFQNPPEWGINTVAVMLHYEDRDLGYNDAYITKKGSIFKFRHVASGGGEKIFTSSKFKNQNPVAPHLFRDIEKLTGYRGTNPGVFCAIELEAIDVNSNKRLFTKYILMSKLLGNRDKQLHRMVNCDSTDTGFAAYAEIAFAVTIGNKPVFKKVD
jgi:hypothetical protein